VAVCDEFECEIQSGLLLMIAVDWILGNSVESD
jgi:hypothetical protein